jgi:low temperature requirement protein LtrA
VVLIPLVSVRLSFRVSILSLTRGFQYLWHFCLRTGADPSVCIRVGTCVAIDIFYYVCSISYLPLFVYGGVISYLHFLEM